jgi:hypothetical protein
MDFKPQRWRIAYQKAFYRKEKREMEKIKKSSEEMNIEHD